MLTKNQIVERLFVGKNFNDCIRKMEPEHLQEDLKMDVIAIVCEWPDEKVIKLHQENSLEFYVVRVILNQVKSKTSPFHKQYRSPVIPIEMHKAGFKVGSDCREDGKRRTRFEKAEVNYQMTSVDDYEERLIREQAEDLAIEEIDRLYWYDAEMIKLYLELGSFRAIEDRTGIPFISCYKNIKKSLGVLKDKAEGTYRPIFTKQERSFIQNNKHAGVLSNTV